MLRLSKLADYATVLMAHMAREESKLYTSRDLAEATHMPPTTVSKILKRLVRLSLLKSVRGASGGYQLPVSAEEISLKQIIVAMEEQHGLIECGIHHAHCQHETYCSVRGNWQLINQAIYKAFDSIKLSDLAKPLDNIVVKIDHCEKEGKHV